LLTTGNVQLGNSDIYFTKTDHNHSGFPRSRWVATRCSSAPPR
jgi:hypothetical protein